MGFTHVPYPNVYRRPAGADPTQYAIGCARFIEETLFHTALPAEEVAAIFVEPIQGEGGYVVSPPEFLRELRRICDRNGILLVADEIQSGAGRTGKWWAIEHAGVQPDIVCMAKGIASGMPLGVTVARADIMDWVPGSHASTFGGNPVCIAAALATISVLERDCLKNAEMIGGYIMERMRPWMKTHSLVGDVRGLGLMARCIVPGRGRKRHPAFAAADCHQRTSECCTGCPGGSDLDCRKRTCSRPAATGQTGGHIKCLED